MKIEEIKNPEFLKKMDNDDLNNLSTDIRNFIISSVSKTGGHLSSNLGIVDLTIALHKVFDYKKDKIIFDVGHQCYTQKIITGRYKEFDKLRKYKGLSGFQKRKESAASASRCARRGSRKGGGKSDGTARENRASG